ncbi:hypothetical protein GYN17_07235 [Lactococcus piscium]|uniref:Uncharacterized protein n=1 Tax=Pseudolactococcus paracarnosus TaxID=2749962 RepID=A0ABT0AMG4_9LACT|nr:hypothetical protein [Lactococcus paracarnosus]MCJ1977759.1 hypothetical protein [Lactococcus paracarnosus]MCJ1983928.1 hypothetical protein [Lactococcus paracarnosus]
MIDKGLAAEKERQRKAIEAIGVAAIQKGLEKRIAIEEANHDALQKMTTILTDTKAIVAYWDKSSYQTPERRRANFKVIDDKSKRT